MKLIVKQLFLILFLYCPIKAIPQSPPKETVQNRLQYGNIYGNPYTMFVRNEGENYFDLNKIKVIVKNEIIKNQPYNNISDFPLSAKFFYDLYNVANEPEPATCNYEADNCRHPLWVKANAVIYILGLKPLKNLSNNSYTFDTLTQYQIEIFGNNAYEGLRHLNTKVQTCLGGNGCSNVRQRALQLIAYLEAYDLLKTGGRILPFDQDAGSEWYGDNTPRNRLREFTKELYVSSGRIINSNMGWKKNHGIICASALGVAAIVLNDAGVRDKFINITPKLFFSIANFNIYYPQISMGWPHPNYSPVKWFQRAHGRDHAYLCLSDCDDGLEDNFFIGQHGIGSRNVPQSNADGTSGYAEGSGYFADLSTAFFPFLRCSDNYLSDLNQKNLLKQTKYINILNWYMNILNVDNSNPSYDNSVQQYANFFAILGGKSFLGNEDNYDGIVYEENTIDLRGDYLLALGFMSEVNILAGKDYRNTKSGNIVLRETTETGLFSFHMLAERDYAIDKSATLLDKSHEDDDAGSFILHTKSKNEKKPNWQIAPDPGYMGWKKEDATNKYWMHNTVEIDDGDYLQDREYDNPLVSEINQFFVFGGYIKSFELTLDYNNTSFLHKSNQDKAIKRNVNAVNIENNVYYIINDYIDASGSIYDIENIKLNQNGNGSIYSSSINKIGDLYRWTYPCNAGGWALSYNLSALNNSVSNKSCIFELKTVSLFNEFSTLAKGITNGDILTRLIVKQPVNKTIFQSFLYPQKCDDGLPIIKKYEGSNYVSTDIDFISGKDTSFEARLGKNNTGNFVNDTACHLHLTRWEGNIPDSASNPFNLPNQANNKLYFDGQKLFVNYHTLAYMGKGYKYCPPSYANFRTATISNGSYLIYKDTLVYSDVPLNFDYSITSKQTYSCSITPLAAVTSGDSIKLKLPDVSRGVEMIATINENDTLKSRYDSLTNYIYIALPSVTKQFTIHEKDLCNDCYFPPLGTHIDTLFVADDKNTHSIPRPLKINYPHGQMQITNSTKISMCEGVYLLNKDSFIIEGPPQSEGMVIPSCAGIDSIAKGSDNSMLIVSAGSALVLNAGSRTYVKNGGAIYVKQNGSLVIKDGAFLQIGDSGTGGWGEVIVEAGGNVYIEPNAHIEYRRKIGDTSDINLFSIAVGNNAAFAGVYFIMDSILKAENIIASTIYPIAICDLDSLNPIVNKDWGYTNFGKPKINIQLRSLILCPNEPLHISLKRIINDASAEITVCRWDSIFANNRFSHMECVNDSIVLDSMPPDPICRLPRILPEDWTYYFDVNTRHQVTISVRNECGKRHDTSILVIVADTPIFSISVPATACEGFNTVSVLASENSHDSVQYAFEVTEMVDTNSINYQIGNPGEVYSYSNYGMLPDTFSFPDYYFKGGRSYLVSLSLTNSCGTRTQEGEVQIPSGVYIELERSTAFANPVHGARSVQLHGYISSADSFRWEPTTWLNRTDTLVVTSTPEDSIYYVLIAKEDNCTALDTVFIRYNHVANAGEGDTVCYTNGKVLLGNPYDLSVYLGFLYYKGGSTFRNDFIANTTADNEYFKQFSLFMHSDLFKNWAIGCNTIYTDFTEDLNREQTVKQPWFINYFEQLTRFDNAGMAALDTFTYYIDQDSALQNNYTNTNNYGSYAPCIQSMLSHYDDFKLTQINDVSIAWYKIVEEDTSFNGSLQESALAVDEPTKTTTYVQQVITPYYAEIDETIIWVDTVMTVYFAPQFQFDSTVVFQDLSVPTSAGSLFSWDFGDGSPGSTEQFPTHEFAAFDTAFNVCLTITNKCGIQTFCDTVYIDSAHWGGSMYTKGIGSNSQTINPQSEYGIQALFYPNPTFGNGILAYTIEDPFEKGELKFYDSFGKLVFETNINKASDQVKIPLDSYANGLYFYTLQTNTGAYVNGKIVKM